MPTHNQLIQYCDKSYEAETESHDGVEFLHIPDNDFTIIIARGTEGGKIFGAGFFDMLRNLSIWPKSVRNTKGHAGFAQGWHAIDSDVFNIIAQNPARPIILAGHSAGGSIMCIAAYRMLYNGYNVAELVTFGAARAIDKSEMIPEILNKLEGITTQYQHVKDPVPGYLKWSDFDHINTKFLGGNSRRSWFHRRFRFHGTDSYEAEL
jgi:hypothetical protein